MSKLRKVTAVLLSVVMLVCCFTVTAGAESIDSKSSTIKSGSSYSEKLLENGNKFAYYKFTAAKSGVLKLSINSDIRQLNVYVYDSNGEAITISDYSAQIGEANWYDGGYLNEPHAYLWINDKLENFKGTLEFKVNKGTYYIEFFNQWGSGKFSFTPTFPSASSSSSGKLNAIAVPLKKGNSMQLTATSTGTVSGTVKWSSSDSSIASVNSSGKVTGKKKGYAYIYAKLGSSTVSILIKVR